MMLTDGGYRHDLLLSSENGDKQPTNWISAAKASTSAMWRRKRGSICPTQRIWSIASRAQSGSREIWTSLHCNVTERRSKIDGNKAEDCFDCGSRPGAE